MQVNSIAHVPSENVLEHRQQITVNSNFICYGLTKGLVRVICRTSGTNAAGRGHLSGPVTDVRYLNCILDLAS